MNAQGYVLTNYHVVYGADQISVALQDGRVFDAVLIGQDQLTDLAVLYVEADNLPVIPQDASLEPQVGDVVLAIGNPFNLGQAITQGVISATGRAGLSPANGYADFMQMDAAINAGNSGGALINSNGVLVGINTAAFQRQRNQDIQADLRQNLIGLAKRRIEIYQMVGDRRRLRGVKRYLVNLPFHHFHEIN